MLIHRTLLGLGLGHTSRVDNGEPKPSVILPTQRADTEPTGATPDAAYFVAPPHEACHNYVPKSRFLSVLVVGIRI